MISLQHDKAFGRLPHSAALDHTIPAPELAMLAWRVTFASNRKSYALNEKQLLHAIAGGTLFKPKGACRNVIRRTITALARRGYTVRQQAERQPDGTWAFARERLTEKAAADEKTGQHVRRGWFDGRWTLNEAAVVLYLRAAKTASASQIAARFGWHRETASRLIGRMLKAGHLLEDGRKKKGGRLFKAAALTSDAGHYVGNPVNGHVGNPVNGNVEIRVNTRTLRGRFTNPPGENHAASKRAESDRPVTGTKADNQQEGSSPQADQKESRFETECRPIIESLARGLGGAHPLNLARSKRILRPAYEVYGAVIVRAAGNQIVENLNFHGAHHWNQDDHANQLMTLCRGMKERRATSQQATSQQGSFETECRRAIQELSSALKEAGYSVSGRDLMRTAYGKWGKHLACGAAYQLADEIKRGKLVHNPAALLDVIARRLKEEGWQPAFQHGSSEERWVCMYSGKWSSIYDPNATTGYEPTLY